MIDYTKYGVSEEFISQFEYPSLKPLDQDWKWCHKYAYDVLKGNIISAKAIKWMAIRHFKDLQRNDIYFDEVEAAKIVKWFKFIPMPDGKNAGKPVILSPDQIHLVVALFAWKWSHDTYDEDGLHLKHANCRRFTNNYAQVARKWGKALCIETLIPTPTGLKKFKDLHIGDCVLGSDGKPTKIVYETDVKYDLVAYDVTFSNGQTVKACRDHLWTTQSKSGTHTLTTEELKKSLYRDSRKTEFTHTIPMPDCSEVKVVSIESCESVPMKCIQVDAPDKLFLCGETGVPTHNTTLTAGITLYCLKVADYQPRGYCLAKKRDQAKLLWTTCANMIKLSPMLQKYFKVRANDILIPSKSGEFRPLASDSNSLDGLNPTVSVLDEVHSLQDRNLYGVIQSAFGAQKEYLFSTITTAGFILDGICTDLRKNGLQVLNPENDVEQDTYHYAIFEIDEGDDWEDESVWYKSNPSLAYGRPSMQYLKERYVEAKLSTGEKANFLTKFCNLFVNGNTKWLNMDDVYRNKVSREFINDRVSSYLREGRQPYIGLDRSRVNDVTSFCILFTDDDGGITCKWVNYVPRRGYNEAQPYLRQIYDNAISNGDLILSTGDIISDDMVIQEVKKLHNEYKPKYIAYDPWSVSQVAEIMNNQGYPMVSVSQGGNNLNEPTKLTENLLVETKLRYNDSMFEFATQCALLNVTRMDNVQVYRDPNNRDSEKIDPLMAMLTALSSATLIKDESLVYEQRGLLFI